MVRQSSNWMFWIPIQFEFNLQGPKCYGVQFTGLPGSERHSKIRAKSGRIQIENVDLERVPQSWIDNSI